MTETRITRVASEHGAVLSALHRASFSNSWSDEMFVSLLRQPGVVGWITQGKEPLGFILIRATANEGEILTFAVLPAFRRQGLGRRLLDKALKEFRKGGIESVFLEVRATNHSAIMLYTELGFTQIGRRAGYYERSEKNPASDRIDAITMKLQLLGKPFVNSGG